MATEEFTAEAVSKILESGDGAGLIKISDEAYASRIESINPQVQKFVASAILNLAEYELPEIVKTSTNKSVATLESIKTMLGGNIDAKVLATIEKGIADASKSFTASDGVQKGWQSFVITCIAEHFDKLKKPKVAKALTTAAGQLVSNGAKRQMNKAEKEAYKASKLGQDAPEEE